MLEEDFLLFLEEWGRDDAEVLDPETLEGLLADFVSPDEISAKGGKPKTGASDDASGGLREPGGEVRDEDND